MNEIDDIIDSEELEQQKQHWWTQQDQDEEWIDSQLGEQ